ncbi:conserved hypothetical protein [Culex quinquefasciatus]|uniref:Peptidase A2 domain-containing protein n=1 Tax=Culex quinquefasciatus TaxID=7176 RepID=B0W160_CULQU|nr:conserved hypothetical protein [Culex quinquefasciatus]|eukprot:XP_001842444.1 conserved hypothetical protein [Culex quinquefasciatus]
MHFVRDCAYKQHVCQDCMQTGHKEGYCSCVSKKFKNKQQTNVNSLYAANRVNSTSKRKFLTVSINNSQASLQFDTGSDITVISRKQWYDNLDSPPLSPTKQIARTASGKSLSLLGELRWQVTLGGVTRTGTFYVTDKQINLFGLDWIELFELWATPMSAARPMQFPARPNPRHGTKNISAGTVHNISPHEDGERSGSHQVAPFAGLKGEMLHTLD